MLPFLGIKDYIYIGIIVTALGAVWYVLDDWHYKPLRAANNTILMLGEQYNECVGVRDACEATLKQKGVEVYQEGLGEEDETSIINFSNLSS